MDKHYLSILYVEDDVSVRESTSEYIQENYGNVLEADNADIAYDIYQVYKPDILLININLSESDGLDLIQKIRTKDIHIPIIIITEDADRERLLRAIKNNVIDYIIKPATHEGLDRAFNIAIETILRKRDHLTTLKTRKELHEYFETCTYKLQHSNIKIGAIFIDLDNFKMINDNLGYQFGDEVLIEISRLLLNRIRKTDIAVRWGGDEFFLFLENVNEETTKNIAYKIRDDIDNLFYKGYNDFTCSIGYDMLKKGDTLDSITSRIDSAMIKAKEFSTNCVVKYTLH